ncbi:MAG: acylphosphatase [Acidimicrobiia bacterium]|nr:acylphosphatase [Acidimicrobiia bacterium]
MSDVTGRDMADLTAVTGTVSGRVQGVGFRVSTEWKARSLRLAGWVRNLPDGRVEFFAQGPPDRVVEFAGWLEVGPRAARPEHVALTPVPPDPNLTSFTVRV